ncbi:hypothetical protein DM01DRAFT_1318772 [Hesseltinella vesiculosa]|uniref:Myb-like domain-containing protein n=1 Tax=Hesseltinella vesiculosa TaxID=101127 RepID=A0A1X2GNR8_9FUNG|nr:hypothetical protein DM01DRAFT_1318772 [Hesseltinella vesiculosa]
MDLASILNPMAPCFSKHRMGRTTLQSPPPSPRNEQVFSSMKPRSRFSLLEDSIICEGVANGLTWGQISGRLPHRKRATCFNRYRTLQGIRKSRKSSISSTSSAPSPSPSSSYSTSKLHIYRWYPSPPPTVADPYDPSSPCYHRDQRRSSVCSTLSACSLPSPASTFYQSSRRSSIASVSFFPSSPSFPYPH